MIMTEAKIEGANLIIGNARIRLLCDVAADADAAPILEELANRWNAYRKMIKFLERAEYVFDSAILRTPTGDYRNKCTDLNIERMQFINAADVRIKIKEVKHEGP